MDSAAVELFRRQRIRLMLAAYAYECLNESIMSDADFDRLALEVDKTKHIATGLELSDKFFSEQFTPDTGMWIRKHPEYLNGKVQATYEKVFKMSEQPRDKHPHKTFVHRQVLAFMLENTVKLTEEDAKALITAIVKKQNPYIKVCY